MKNPSHFLPSTRREFLRSGARGAGLLAFSRFVPAFLVESARAQTPAPEKDRTILVLVQLAGGNDGLNTVVPFADPHYRRLRPTLGLPEADLLKLNDTQALHGSCAALHALWGDGKLGIVQNVGYPNPNRSHFRSTEIWETASESNEFLPTGWLGRYFDNECAGTPEGAAAVIDLTGPVERHLVYEVQGGRAGSVDEPSAPPVVSVVMDTETFVILALGRRPASELADRLTLEGDRELGQRIVDQLGMMI